VAQAVIDPDVYLLIAVSRLDQVAVATVADRLGLSVRAGRGVAAHGRTTVGRRDPCRGARLGAPGAR
jgi:hypothetical protein